jgi:hypothetical protein
VGIPVLRGGDLGFLLMTLTVERILQVALWAVAQFFKYEPRILE